MPKPCTFNRITFLACATSALSVTTLACSDGDDPPNTGGAPAAGGVATSGGAASGGMASGGASGGTDTGGAPAAGGAPETGGTAGTGGSETGGTLVCSGSTDQYADAEGHTHDITIPQEDVDAGSQSEPWLLEDGGTGHAHSLTLSAYDWLYLGPGYDLYVTSTEEEGHSHKTLITCTETGADSMTCTGVSVEVLHDHELTIPPDDLDDGSQAAPWVAEDGGIGHTHTVTLTDEEVAALTLGSHDLPTSEDAGHSHTAEVFCTSK